MPRNIGSDPNSLHEYDTDGSSSSACEDEALSLFLGGPDLAQLSPSAWDQTSQSSKDAANDSSVSQSGLPTIVHAPSESISMPSSVRLHSESSIALTSSLPQPQVPTEWAHAWNGPSCGPPTVVRVFDTGDATRGNISIATRPIPRGATVWTEQAAAFVVLNDLHHGNSSKDAPFVFCQACAKSLQPATAALADPNKGIVLPYLHLWPIPPYEAVDTFQPLTGGMRPVDTSSQVHDRHGRVHCTACRAWFCHKACAQRFDKEVGSCCLWQRLVHDLVQHQHTNESSRNSDEELVPTSLPPAIWLGARIFVQVLRHSRLTGQLTGAFLDGLCGEPSDLVPLELHDMADPLYNRVHTITSPPPLLSIYERIVHYWRLTTTEQASEKLDLAFLQRCTAVAARNAVGLRLVSPFSSYHAALVRQTGGFGSDRHAAVTRQLVKAVEGSSGSDVQNNDNDTAVVLNRDLDRILRDRLAPMVAAIFPLTARLNHNCLPNAALQANFVTATIDVCVVHERDIQAGDEVSISYIDNNRALASKARRRRELRAKYLFECNCALCRDEFL